jgi:hypothetical protein
MTYYPLFCIFYFLLFIFILILIYNYIYNNLNIYVLIYRTPLLSKIIHCRISDNISLEKTFNLSKFVPKFLHHENRYRNSP